MLNFILQLYLVLYLLLFVVYLIQHIKEREIPQHPFFNKNAHQTLLQQDKNQIIQQFGEPDFRVTYNYWGYHCVNTKDFWIEHHITIYLQFNNNRLIQINDELNRLV